MPWLTPTACGKGVFRVKRGRQKGMKRVPKGGCLCRPHLLTTWCAKESGQTCKSNLRKKVARGRVLKVGLCLSRIAQRNEFE